MLRHIAAVAAALFAVPAVAAPTPVAVARGGKPLLPVVVAADATPRVKAAAADLAAYLGKMAGAKFEVATGDGKTGLAVGLPAHFPALPFQDKWAKPGTL